MNTQQHTPGPWSTLADCRPGASRNLIAAYRDDQMIFIAQEVRDQDAEHIVRACNAHDELVAALRAMLDVVGSPNNNISDLYKGAIKHARAMLDKAESVS